MNEGRLGRALVTLITLAGGMWVLRSVYTPPAPDLVAKTMDPASAVVDVCDFEPNAQPIEIQSLPLVAMDNTCFDGVHTDFSGCTRMLSGGPARTYVVRVEQEHEVRIHVQPGTGYFDVSLALLDEQGTCLAGKDENGAGIGESIVLAELRRGNYRVIVGGYGGDCGSYLLTVRNAPPPIADLRDAHSLASRNGVVIRWETYGEVDLSHFELYRLTPSGRQFVAQLRHHGSASETAWYRFVDRQPLPESEYELEAVATDGRREVFPVSM